MSDRLVILTITHIEAEHLDDLVGQFLELLPDADAGDATPTDDPALGRLVPDAYRDDDEAARDFRRATQSDLLGRRTVDALRMREDLAQDAGQSGADPMAVVDITLDEEGTRAWMRTLAAIRLVIASRLGIDTEDTRDGDTRDGDTRGGDDARFGVYDWLGYRLEGLIRAIDG